MIDPTKRDSSRALSRVRIVLLALLSLMLAGVAILSLRWNYGYDAAQMLYYGRLIGDLHFVPYRDIFEENIAGAMLAFTGIGALIDWSNKFLLRIFDLIYLACISMAAWRWLRPLGKPVAWAAIVLFGLVYLLGGPGFSTQREYVFLLPIVAALAVATWPRPMPDPCRALIVGVLFGLATTIKPHAGVGLAAVAIWHYFDIRARQDGAAPSLRQLIPVAAAYGVGVLIPVAAMFAYLAISGGLGPWILIATGYWPLYSNVSDTMNVLHGMDRVAFMTSALIGLGGQQMWLIPAVIGAGVALWPGVLNARQRRLAWLVIGMFVCYLAFPAITGQFYPQHWLPMTFFLLTVGALCFIEIPGSVRWPVAVVPLAAVLIALALRGDMLTGAVGQMVDTFVYGKPTPSIDGDRAEEIAGYLKANLKPGETVQPLDQVGYTLHGMLLARARPATRFQSDPQFYSAPESPYIQGLRAEFIDALKQSPPRYIIDVFARVQVHSDSPLGPFVQFSELIRSDYMPVYLGHGFIVYEHAAGRTRPGLIVYPSEYSGISPVEAAPLRADLVSFTSGRPEANPDGVARRLEALAADHDLLLYENLGEESKSVGVIERWLAVRAARVSQDSYATTRLVTYLSPRVACGEPTPLEATFRDEITIDAAGVTLAHIENERFACVHLEMSALASLSRGYVISVHVVDSSGGIVAQYDSQPHGGLMPTTDWTPGETVIDRFAVRLPGDLEAGNYQVQLYISDPDTGETLRTADGEDGVTIGEIELP